LRAPRANLIFGAEKNIRTKNEVLIEGKSGPGFSFHKIDESARMVFIRALSPIRADGVRPRKAQLRCIVWRDRRPRDPDSSIALYRGHA